MDARNANRSQTVCCKLIRWGHIAGWCFQGESGKYSDVNVTVNKHAASATGAQQSADLTKTFPNLERLGKLMSVND